MPQLIVCAQDSLTEVYNPVTTQYEAAIPLTTAIEAGRMVFMFETLNWSSTLHGGGGERPPLLTLADAWVNTTSDWFSVGGEPMAARAAWNMNALGQQFDVGDLFHTFDGTTPTTEIAVTVLKTDITAHAELTGGLPTLLLQAQDFSDSPAVGPVTTYADRSLLVAGLSTEAHAVVTPPAGWTLRAVTATATGQRHYVYDYWLPTSGTTVSFAATLSADDTWALVCAVAVLGEAEFAGGATHLLFSSF